MPPVHFSLYYWGVRRFRPCDGQASSVCIREKSPAPLFPTDRVNGLRIRNGAVGTPQRRRISSGEDAGGTSDLA
jgi:hypothetical protein